MLRRDFDVFFLGTAISAPPALGNDASSAAVRTAVYTASGARSNEKAPVRLPAPGTRDI